MMGHIPACQVGPLIGVWQSVAVINRHDVGDPITRVQDTPCGFSCGKERKDPLNAHKERRDTVGLKKEFGLLDFLVDRVERRLGEKDWGFFQVDF